MVGLGGELRGRSLRLAAAACEGGRVVTITSRPGTGKGNPYFCWKKVKPSREGRRRSTTEGLIEVVNGDGAGAEAETV